MGKPVIPIEYRFTQAQIDNGDANSLSGVRIVITDANNQPTGKVYESGAAGVAPVENSGSIKNNFAGTTAPAVTNDSSQGYAIGSRWIDTTGDESYICLDATLNNAVWSKTTVGVISEIANLQSTLDGKSATTHNHDATYTAIAHGTNVSNPHSVTKTQVGLGSVDNTADTSKPVSTAQQSALDGKSATSHTHTGTYEPADATILKEAEVVNTLVGTATNLPLSAAQGKALKDTADTLATTVGGKQATLTSGNTIKTVNGASVLGSGDIVITPTTVSSTVPTHNLDLVSDNYAGRALHFRPNGMTATTNLATWSDSSGNSRNAIQATAANQPDVVENVLNGLPVVDFDGTDDYMDTSSSLNLNASTVFAVIRPTVSAIDGKTILGATSPGPEWKLGPSRVPSIDLSGVGVLINGTTSLVAGQWTLLVFKKTGVINTNGIYINGTADTMAANAAGVIGAYTPRLTATHVVNSGTCFDGDIAEIVVFPTALSDTERQKVEGYLAHKYALLANLNAGHPYKTTAPQVGDLQTYADNAAAITGGLTVGQVYMTATGQLMVRY